MERSAASACVREGGVEGVSGDGIGQTGRWQWRAGVDLALYGGSRRDKRWGKVWEEDHCIKPETRGGVIFEGGCRTKYPFFNSKDTGCQP